MPPRDGPDLGHLTIDHDQWASLRAATPNPLLPDELEKLQGINERLDMDEVNDIYLPLSRWLNLLVAGTHQVRTATDTFLGGLHSHVPYVIGIGGSVAVGKSTTARVLQALLARWPDHPMVELVTTDGFLYPNAVLEARGLLNRKGFPESYDVARLIDFLMAVKKGDAEALVPVYDHATYDIVPDRYTTVSQPDILILEGLNVLQTTGHATLFVSDFFDFSIYVDADEADIETWYVDRFWKLVEGAREDATSFFHQFRDFDQAASEELARNVWRGINRPNLVDNILPTRSRARLVLEKGPDHKVRRVHLRR